jgi:PLP dependent protein
MPESLASKRPEQLQQALEKIQQRIQIAAESAGRPAASIKLLAVSKRQPMTQLQHLYQFGQRLFGENYVNEAQHKWRQWQAKDVEWHFIGPVQSNKTRVLAEQCHWVQTIDRPKLLERLARQRPDQMGPLNICIQINISAESHKAGCNPDQMWSLAELSLQYPNLKLRGLMSIGQANAKIDEYQHMQSLFGEMKERYQTVDTLSMGMSADLEQAIWHGATLVRIGTDLFGPRT